MKLTWAAVLMCLALSPTAALAQTETGLGEKGLGEWRGVISIPQGDLHLIVRISKARGALSGVMESPDQAGAGPMPLTVAQAGPQRLAFDVPSIQASYTGEWSESAHGWSGQWTQSGIDLPLTLSRAGVGAK
jgi:hypothetical protein